MVMDKKIKRLENNEYAMNSAYERLQQAIEVEREQEIYAAIGELLLWVLTTDKWHEKNNTYYRNIRKGKERQTILGLKHAYNLMKHNMNFYKIHKKEGGVEFPIQFPLTIPEITVVWGEVIRDPSGHRKNQEDNYNKYIEEKEIIDTFDKVIGMLRKENKKIKDRN